MLHLILSKLCIIKQKILGELVYMKSLLFLILPIVILI